MRVQKNVLTFRYQRSRGLSAIVLRRVSTSTAFGRHSGQVSPIESSKAWTSAAASSGEMPTAPAWRYHARACEHPTLSGRRPISFLLGGDDPKEPVGGA